MFRHTSSGGRLPAIAAIAVAGALFAAAPAMADTETANLGETSVSVGISTHAAAGPASLATVGAISIDKNFPAPG